MFDAYDDSSDGVFSFITVAVNVATLALTIYCMVLGTQIDGGEDL